MVSVAIKRFDARLRVADSQQQRLRRILAAALDGGLEAALGRGGIASGGEICIREIDAQARLDLAETDDRLAARLAVAIADAIAAGASGQRAGLIHYRSQAQAWADFAVGTLSGDFSRAWAWRQLGIGQADYAVSAADAARQVLSALNAQPRHAVATLAGLAQVPGLFARLARHGPAAHWRDLARRVVETMGGDPAILLPPVAESVPAKQADRAMQWIQRSLIAQAALLSDMAESGAEPSPQLLAALVLAEVEPALLRLPADSVRIPLHAVASALAAAASAKTPDAQAQRQTQAKPILAASEALAQQADTVGKAGQNLDAETPPLPHQADQPETWRDIQALATSESVDRKAILAEENSLLTETRANDPMTPAKPAAAVPAPRGSKQGQEAETPLLPGQHSLPELRRQGFTHFGGLLFFIHLAESIDLIGQIMRDGRLAGRDPRWGLHRIALALLPTTAADPAVLAFAGLLPDSEAPGADQPPPTEAEQIAVDGLRDSLLEALHGRLARVGLDEAGLVDFVCRRPAEIIADPGWLEAHFALDGVSTEIRAAGLDLDPGWVPWLGLVIRFVYV